MFFGKPPWREEVAERGVPFVPPAAAGGVWGAFRAGCGYSGRLPAEGSRRAKGLEGLLCWRGETEARGLVLWGGLVPFFLPWFLWPWCSWLFLDFRK